jgi:general nucleoside transport system permease protein
MILSSISIQQAQTPKENFWQRAWKVIRLPLLAFITASLFSSLLIIFTDLDVLAAFKMAISGMNALQVVLLVLALLVLAGFGWTYFNLDIVLKRFSKPLPKAINSILRILVVVGGLLAASGLLKAAGYGVFLDSAGSVVKVAYGALLEGALGNPAEIWAALGSGDPVQVSDAFYPLFESMIASVPYIFAGLAVALAFRGGIFNIGTEGQLYIGAVFAVFVGYTLKGIPSTLHITLALLAGATGGALWAFIPAILKVKFSANEVINTIMMNYIAFRLVEWLLNGPMRRPGGDNKPVSPLIEPTAELPRFFAYPSRLHLGFFLAILTALVIYILLFKTSKGFEIDIMGLNSKAARYAGVKIKSVYVLNFCLSGALAGLAGAVEVLGVSHMVSSTISPGYGFDSIALAILGGNHPFGVVLASLLFGTLRSGAVRMQNMARIPSEIISVVQSLVIVFIAAPVIIRKFYFIRERSEKEVQAEPALSGEVK